MRQNIYHCHWKGCPPSESAP